MIKATVLTRYGRQEELYFETFINFSKWYIHWNDNQNSVRLVHGHERSIRMCDIARVISVEEEN